MLSSLILCPMLPIVHSALSYIMSLCLCMMYTVGGQEPYSISLFQVTCQANY